MVGGKGAGRCDDGLLLLNTVEVYHVNKSEAAMVAGTTALSIRNDV